MAVGSTELIQKALTECRDHQTEFTERELYEKLRELVSKMVSARAGDIRHHKREIIADVFVVIFQKLKEFDESRSGEAWVCEIVNRTVLAARNREKRSVFWRPLEIFEGFFSFFAPEPEPYPGDDIERLNPSSEAAFNRLMTARDKLGPDCRMLMALRYDEKREVEEIASEIKDGTLPIPIRRRRSARRKRDSQSDFVTVVRDRIRYCRESWAKLARKENA